MPDVIDTSKIEKKAVGAIDDRFFSFSRLRSKIDVNDKTASYDGYIEINDDPTGAKRGSGGRVEVQVKGRSVDALAGTTCSFPVDKTDLQAFLQGSGALFFLVQVERSSAHTRIFYQSFPPVFCRFLLGSMGDKQEKFSCKFRRFPEDEAEVMNIIRFLRDSRSDAHNIERGLVAGPNPTQIRIRSDQFIDFQNHGDIVFIDFAQGHQSLLFADENGRFMPSLVRELVIIKHARDEPQWQDAAIGAGDDVYYHHAGSRLGTDNVSLYMGPIVIDIDRASWEANVKKQTLTDVHMDVKIHIHINTVPDETVHGLQFLLAVIDNDGMIEVNHRPVFRINFDDKNMRADIEGRLAAAKKLNKLLKSLDIDMTQDIGKIDGNALNTLHQGIIEGRPVLMKSQDASGVRAIRLGDFNIVVLCKKAEEEGTYHIFDLFSPDLVCVSSNPQGASESQGDFQYVTSIYAVAHSKLLAQMANTHLNNVASSFQDALGKRKEQPANQQDSIKRQLLGDANQAVLRLVRAADMITRNEVEIPDSMKLSKWDALLNAANKLNQWISDFEGQNDPISMINRMQIKFRLNSLNDQDRRNIRHLIAVNKQHEILMACHLLLGSIEDAKKEQSLLPEGDRKQLEAYPISSLFHPQEVQRPVITATKSTVPQIVNEFFENSSSVQRKKLISDGKIVEMEGGVYSTPQSAQ